ncbi:signal peptide protein, YSIRK family [Oesophagostomum dentatum]|uniref:Signal peptide protein, YSIRK family n=1 Tax=Oesophagostomum dentatum TaxID=61180 RepID=A0A0B1T9Z3_OESDE|nr:signal peptide protein, YSIRK family [Oesophagostomum dentatum]
MYYASSEQNIAAQMRNTFQEYKQFSFRYNGVLTSILVALGLAGSLLLLKQIEMQISRFLRIILLYAKHYLPLPDNLKNVLLE